MGINFHSDQRARCSIWKTKKQRRIISNNCTDYFIIPERQVLNPDALFISLLLILFTFKDILHLLPQKVSPTWFSKRPTIRTPHSTHIRIPRVSSFTSRTLLIHRNHSHTNHLQSSNQLNNQQYHFCFQQYCQLRLQSHILRSSLLELTLHFLFYTT